MVWRQKKRHPFTVKLFWRREPLSVGKTKFLFQVRLCIQNSSVPKTEKPILLLSFNKWFLSNIGSLWWIISEGPGFQLYSISFELSSRRNTEPIEGTTASCIKINFYLYHFPVRLSFLFKLKVANFLYPSIFEEVTHVITKAAEPVPALTLSSGIELTEGEVFVSEDLSIKASAIVSTTAADQLWWP